MGTQMQNQLLNYHSTLQSLSNSGDANEHSFRTAFENLLNTLKPTQDINIIHEPKAKQGQGNIRPDFKVTRQMPQEKGGYESLVGFIECKNFGTDLSPLIKGKQIEKYLTVCHNIILTDYNRFILLSYGKVIDDWTLFPNGFDSNLFSTDSTPTKAQLIQSIARISQLLGEFFHASAQITQKEELIKVLSTQSFYLSSAIFSAFSTQDLASRATQKNTIFSMIDSRTQDFATTDFLAIDSHAQDFITAFDKSYQSFRDLESTEISPIEFCDIVAQSIVYGAFVAHIESEIYEIDKIPTEMFVALLPRHFVTLREFIESSLPARNLPDSITYALSNIIKTIALIDKPSLATSFQKEISELSIYLYEDFLKAYDDLRGEQKRKEGGVFYTPEPIVDMIVRSIDELLQTHFGKSFSDENVKVLDFATGTGSFLAKVFELILENQSEVFAKNVIINKCFRDIYGFEMSFVPYIVAHLKLSSLLKNKGFSEFSAYQKFQVYLTNTLDLDTARQIHLQVPFDTLKNERDKSLRLKHKDDLLVILGNPPYNVKSKNKGAEILQLLDSYKMGLNETKINLDDDYIKFIRFAQWKLTEQNQKHGIMGFITNNSFLSGRTHRKMRESLAKTFDEIYILNLHGHNEIDGKNDKNVFDIRVGVCISLFVKYERESSLRGSEATEAIHESKIDCQKSANADSFNDSAKKSSLRENPQDFRGNPKNNDSLATIHYFSTKDNEILRRKDKFALLNKITNKGLKSIKWKKLKLDSPYFWFVPKSFKSNEYNKFWALAKNESLGESKAIFENFNNGIATDRDNLMIDKNKNNLIAKCKKAFSGDFDKSFAKQYQINNSSSYAFADKLRELNFDKDAICPIHYRPFDIRFVYYKLGFTSRPAYDTMKHIMVDKNIGISFPKSSLNLCFDYCLVIDKITERKCGGKNTGSETYIAPLYCFVDSQNEVGKVDKTPNFTEEFNKFKAKHKVLKNKTPEQILAFIYANLYNPTYRTKYVEYLKIGFPRIDFEVSESKFESLANLGQKLIDLHLMKTIPQDKSIDLVFRENANKSNPNFTLDKPKYEPNQNKIILNADLEIVGVSAEVWDYTIGGYKVLEKWLKYRANDKNGAITLEQSDFTHILNVAKILKATIKLQKELASIK